MKTLITGAAGFVGAAVLRELLKKGHKVKALVRKSSVLDNLKNLDVEIIYGDLKNRDSLKRCLKNCKYLFHFPILGVNPRSGFVHFIFRRGGGRICY